MGTHGSNGALRNRGSPTSHVILLEQQSDLHFKASNLVLTIERAIWKDICTGVGLFYQSYPIARRPVAACTRYETNDTHVRTTPTNRYSRRHSIYMRILGLHNASHVSSIHAYRAQFAQ